MRLHYLGETKLLLTLKRTLQHQDVSSRHPRLHQRWVGFCLHDGSPTTTCMHDCGRRRLVDDGPTGTAVEWVSVERIYKEGTEHICT